MIDLERERLHHVRMAHVLEGFQMAADQVMDDAACMFRRGNFVDARKYRVVLISLSAHVKVRRRENHINEDGTVKTVKERLTEVRSRRKN